VKRALVSCLVIACGRPPTAPKKVVTDLGASADTDAERRQRMISELSDDILASYERDDSPDTDTQLIDARIGPAHIGVGPGDILYGDDVKLRASSRWPLAVEPGTSTTVRSKKLDVHLASDRSVSAAWMSDEVSWRVSLCGRTAVIPLRMTALYAHDGDRWVEVFEHVSFGSVPHATAELEGARVKTVVASRSLADDLSRTLTPLLYRQSDRLPSIVSLDPKHIAEDDVLQPAPTLLLAPDPDGEWHGTDDLSRAQLVDGVLNPDDRRIGPVGATLTQSTIAYWVGNFIATLADRPGVKGGKVRLRGTFVFEKRPACKNGACPKVGAVDCTDPKSDCKWLVVQGHVSQPIDDAALAQRVFGTALLADTPLQITCDDGTRSAPAAGAGSGSATPPAAR
jgi:hypothetical protein